ncbi:efflux RND transporter periplasmic adaptor subunit [Aquabacterium sp.]|jgi:membrane fusion protein (multidrug efflux system)|uniref:efflux RND transporter periplasmic adaptor subunit n=1 Tax=Aquabacterium sp. TaxID=1872578 RepID=UPI0026040706|nr:efflux RND transporter periplasmic adaptor subunit [Aquabacterium sp.]MDD2977199.1 efflux RND transporter periplasmic adaptor subunit [Aquabacterium sp.]
MGLALCAVTVALLAGCGDDKAAAPAGAPGGGMPPAQVGVITVQPQSVPVMSELPGRLEAVRTAQVRARVAGILQKRLFTEGADVKAGQPLFQIDPATFQAALDSAQATQAKAEANLAQASALVKRYEPLQAAKAISPQEFLNAQVAQRQAQADVAGAKAAVQTARINLGYAGVTAPISGRIGRALVTEGALVGQGEATQLALIQQVNTLYVNFTQPANEVIKLRAAMKSGALKRAGADAAEIRVVLDDGKEYPLPGKLLFSDLSVDATSGQVSLRAELPNPEGLLLPGMYVRVRLEQAQVDGGILLPQQAVTRGAQADTVMVVDDKGMVSPRQIKLGGAKGSDWVVLGGLKTGEQVMVDGFQKMMNPKAPVKAVPWQQPSAQAGMGAAPAPTAAASAAASK